MKSRSVFVKLFLVALLLIATTTAVLDFTLRRSWEKSLRSELESGLLDKTQMLAQLVPAVIHLPEGCSTLDAKQAADLANLVSTQSHIAQARITVVNSCGTVLADSEADPARMENHAGRPEFAAVLHGSASGEDARLSRTVGIEFVYVATPLAASGGAIRLAYPLTSVRERLVEVRRNLLLASALSILIAALGAGIWASSVTRRLDRIVGFAERISAGDLSARIDEASGDQLAQVALALDSTARKLEESFQNVKTSHDQLETLLNSMQEPVLAVSADNRVQWANGQMRSLLQGALKIGSPLIETIRDPEFLRAIQQTNQEHVVHNARSQMIVPGRVFNVTAAPMAAGGAVAVLFEITEIERIEKTRRDFIANVSHELRTPLTSIQGYTETLLESELDKSSGEFLEIIRKNAIRMASLTEDLLVLARVESGEEQFRLQAVTPSTILRDAEESFLEKAKLRRQILRVKQESDAAVLCDPHKIHQVFANLLDNALKYSGPGTQVLLGARNVNGAVEFYVRDSGIGVPSEHLPRIFERFYRVDKARSIESGGTGLGLAIAKHIVLKHRGTIRAESELHHGSTFLFTLPMA